MQAVIIDDERVNIDLLQDLLAKYCPEVQVVGYAENVDQALEVILKQKPDLIFLDIELNHLSARDLLNALDLDRIQVIIVSAYDKYALEMHKYPVADYLLKPVVVTELVAAVKKTGKYLERMKQSGNLLRDHSISRYIALPEKDHLSITDMQEIVRLEASGNYTKIYTREEKTLVSSKTLGDYEALLPPNQFMRVHHSHIVNLIYVRKYLRTKNGSLVLTNGCEIPISANRKKEVTERIVF